MKYTYVKTSLRAEYGRYFHEVFRGSVSLGLVLNKKMRDYIIAKDKLSRGYNAVLPKLVVNICEYEKYDSVSEQGDKIVKVYNKLSKNTRFKKDIYKRLMQDFNVSRSSLIIFLRDNVKGF